jgi:hypothetical protein
VSRQVAVQEARPAAHAAGGVAAPPPAAPARAGSGLAPLVAGRLVPAVRIGVRRVGPAGLVGAALLVAVAVLTFALRAPMVSEIGRLGGELARAPHVAATSVAPAARLSADDLPTRDKLPAAVGRLVQEAEHAGLTLPSGKYEISAVPSVGIVRYRVSLPVHGSYPQVRTFIDAVIADVPYAAVSGLSIGRKGVADATVDADVRFTLYLREVR